MVEDHLGDLADDRVLLVDGAVRKLHDATRGLDPSLAVARQTLHVARRIDITHLDLVGERDDADEHGDRDGAHEEEGGRGILALRLLEGRDTIGDRLHPGEGRAARGEGPQEKEHAGRRAEPTDESRVLDDVEFGALGER